MKIRTDIIAGMTYEQCDAERKWWKYQSDLMEGYAANRSMVPPAELWFPCQGNPPIPGSGGSGSATTLPAPPPSAGGGWVAGVWVPDQSGICG